MWQSKKYDGSKGRNKPTTTTLFKTIWFHVIYTSVRTHSPFIIPKYFLLFLFLHKRSKYFFSYKMLFDYSISFVALFSHNLGREKVGKYNTNWEIGYEKLSWGTWQTHNNA